MKKLLPLLAAGMLLLAGCGYKPTDYTVTQYRPDGTVQQTWHTNSFSTSGNCVMFSVKGEPTQTNFFACGTVHASSTAELQPAKGDAKYTVRLWTPDGKPIGTWDATSASANNGCISFTPVGDSVTHYACGTAIAEANNVKVSPDSPKPYQVQVLSAGGEALQSWEARSYTASSGVITVYVAGDSSNTPRYATGQVLASPLSR